MLKIIETLDIEISRSEWHRAVKEFGINNCKVERIEVEGGSPIFRITITENAWGVCY